MLNGFLEFANKDSKMLVVSRLPDLENEMSRLGVLLSGLVRERATSGYTLAERGIDDLLLRRRVSVKLVADLQRYASAPAAVEIRKQRLDLSVILLQQVTNVCHFAPRCGRTAAMVTRALRHLNHPIGWNASQRGPSSSQIRRVWSPLHLVALGASCYRAAAH
jgi:hypothetical protein